MATHLIIGGTGFIGRHVGLALARSGERVRLAGRSRQSSVCLNAEPLLSYECIDLSRSDLGRALDGVDIVHHYAWSTIPQTSEADPAADIEGNVGGTIGLLEAIRCSAVRRLVFCSSGGTVYGKTGGKASREDDELLPSSLYGIAKATAEKYIVAYRQRHGLDAVILRLSNPFGVGQSLTRNQGAATTFGYKALRNEPIQIYGDGDTIRDYFHISDGVGALIAAATVDLGAGEPFVFNIGSGSGTSLKGIVDTLAACLGRPVAVEHLPARRTDLPFNVLDTTRAARVLGWRPRLSFADGIGQMLADYRSGLVHWSTLR